MRIRAVEERDREPLLHLADQVFGVDEVEVARELIVAATVESRDYRILLADNSAHGSADGFAGIAGYVCYGPTPMTQATYDLYWIGCYAHARGHGVASSLIRAMEVDLRSRGGSAVRVETEDGPEYLTARRLYERLDYPIAAHLPDFYRPGDGLVIYYKRLT